MPDPNVFERVVVRSMHCNHFQATNPCGQCIVRARSVLRSFATSDEVRTVLYAVADDVEGAQAPDTWVHRPIVDAILAALDPKEADRG